MIFTFLYFLSQIKPQEDKEDGLSIFFIAKRSSLWEPIYIGTNNEPPYDERLTWDGRGDKMTQGHIMCILDYDFAILNEAFLIHKPGIKTSKHHNSETNQKKVEKQRKLVKSVIMPELRIMYGIKDGCGSI